MKKSLLFPLLSFLACLLLGIVFELSFGPFIKLMILYVMINMILGLSLNLVNGFTGQFSLGHAGFMAIGAYVSAYLSLNCPLLPGIAVYFSFVLFALAGGLAAAFAGLIVGIPSLRLRGDYLAIVTLGFGEIVRVLLLNLEVVGGARGLNEIPAIPRINYELFSISRFFSAYIVAAFWVLVTVFVIYRLIRSSYGLTFMSVRDDEIAAEAMGVNTTKTKVWAFIISSFFAGIAGAIFAHVSNYLNPATFSFLKSVDAVIMVVLGGMGSITGSLVAAVFITLMPEVLRPLQSMTGVDLRMVIYALSLVLLMIWRPQGLFGNKELIHVWKHYSQVGVQLWRRYVKLGRDDVRR
ncbi:MAG: branched-chain amino acid ABC transporter permease [Bdellovibrionaceae bacterium]|nr:branched-chain amino acid ABC transporter permease [Pseudobdellovibrionaceae bacterium]